MAAAGRRRVDVSLSSPSPPPLPSFSPSLAARSTVGTLGESIFDSDSVPSSFVEEIAPVLRAANEVDDANPCVAYLCRFYAFEKAHRLDPISSGPGVRQFKTTLLQTLERGNDPRLKGKILRTDAREMRSFYNHYNKKYIKPLQNSADKAHQ